MLGTEGVEVLPGGKAACTEAREMTWWKGRRMTHTGAQCEGEMTGEQGEGDMLWAHEGHIHIELTTSRALFSLITGINSSLLLPPP